MTEQLSEPPPILSPARMKSEPVERPQSPEANCAICLEEFNNKSYTDSCLHEFCFLCLKEWSKIKPECPLCKQRFQTIIHNIRSHQEYDEYHVGSQPGTGVSFLDTQSVLLNLAFQRAAVYNHQSYRPGNSFRAIVDNSLYHRAFDSMTRTPLLYIHPTSVVHAPENNHSPPFDQDFGATISVGRARNRRDVYRHDRWVRPSLSSRIRESSPEFYRLNPATTHRLVPWLTRELNVLLDVSMDPQVYCQEILRLITIYPIRSRQFREAMRPVLGERVDHFIHEFYHFAISVHDMVSYDIVVEYEPGSRPMRFSRGEPSDSDSDIEVVRVLPKLELGSTQSTGLDLSNRAGPSNASSQPSPEIVIEINDSSSSDDEVEIISVRAATPETIIIDSSESEAEVTDQFTNQNCPGRYPDDPESSRRSECSLGSGCDSMRNMLHGLEDELIETYRNPSLFENASRSPTPPMPYLRPINSKEPSSPSSSESSDSRCSTPQPPTPLPSQSSSSSWCSSSSVSNYSDCGKRYSSYRKKKKKVSSSKQGKSRKRSRKSVFKIEDSSSDEEYEPRSSRPRLRSVVVKPEPSSTRRLHRSNHYIFPTDSD